MKAFPQTAFLLLFGLIVLVAAWSKEDHEIFRLRDEVLTAEGHNVTFYSFFGIAPSASLDDITKAYRKRSRQLHPDKAVQQAIAQQSAAKSSEKAKSGARVSKGLSQKERAQIIKEANERYQRLAVVAGILKGPQRQRYDHFLRNGFPTWRGTGYLYERLRPGLGTVLLGLLITFGGAVHYFTLYMNYKKQREFVERYISHARRTAWGNNGGMPRISGLEEGFARTATPPAPEMDAQQMQMNRKQKRMQEKEGRRKDTTKATRAARLHGKTEAVDGISGSGTSTPNEQPVPQPQQPQGHKKRVVAENGKILVVDQAGDVYLEEETEDGEKHEYLLDVSSMGKCCMNQ